MSTTFVDDQAGADDMGGEYIAPETEEDRAFIAPEDDDEESVVEEEEEDEPKRGRESTDDVEERPSKKARVETTKVVTTFPTPKICKAFAKVFDLFHKDDYVLVKWGNTPTASMMQMDYLNSNRTVAVLATMTDPMCEVSVPGEVGDAPIETNLLVDSLKSRLHTVNNLSTGRGKDLPTTIRYDPKDSEVWIECEDIKGTVTTVQRDDDDSFDFADYIGRYPVMMEVDLERFSRILREFCKVNINTEGVRISIEDLGPSKGGYLRFTAGEKSNGTLSDLIELSEDTMVECRQHPDVMDSDQTYTSTVIDTIVKMADTCPKKSDSKTGADRRVSVAIMKDLPLYASVKLSTPMDPNGVASCIHAFVTPKITNQ